MFIRLCSPVLLALLPFVLPACGNEETAGRAIRSSTDVLDVALSQSAPDRNFRSDATAAVGFDNSGNETRLLLFFPKLRELWDSDTIQSSITQVEILLIATDVPVNPENIELYAMTRSWTPQATWNSPFPLLPQVVWNTAAGGGDFDRETAAITPTLLTPTEASAALIEISFNVTELVRQMIQDKRDNFGFAVVVKESSDNSRNSMEFRTFNTAVEGERPRAILAFTTNDTLQE